MADDIPAEVSDQARGERRQARVRLGVEHLQGLGDGLHGVAVDGCTGGGAALPVDGAVNGGEGRAGRRADEGVTCPRSGLTLGGNRGGFEQEGAVGRFDGRALVVLEYEGTVDADGGERVGEDFNVDGNHSGSGCTGAEFFARGGDGAQILHYCTPLGWGDAGGAAMRQGRWRVLCSVYPRVLIRVGPWYWSVAGTAGATLVEPAGHGRDDAGRRLRASRGPEAPIRERREAAEGGPATG